MIYGSSLLLMRNTIMNFNLIMLSTNNNSSNDDEH